MFDDLQGFDEVYRKWAKVPVEWHHQIVTEE